MATCPPMARISAQTRPRRSSLSSRPWCRLAAYPRATLPSRWRSKSGATGRLASGPSHMSDEHHSILEDWPSALALAIGLSALWVALASPLAALHHQLLSAHMVQHVLLMAVAPPL